LTDRWRSFGDFLEEFGKNKTLVCRRRAQTRRVLEKFGLNKKLHSRAVVEELYRKQLDRKP
jgi:hypothetical protein